MAGCHLTVFRQSFCALNRTQLEHPCLPVQVHGCIKHISIFLLGKLLSVQKWRRKQKLSFFKSLTRKLIGPGRITASLKHSHPFVKRVYKYLRGFAWAQRHLSEVHPDEACTHRTGLTWHGQKLTIYTVCDQLFGNQRLNPGFSITCLTQMPSMSLNAGPLSPEPRQSGKSFSHRNVLV